MKNELPSLQEGYGIVWSPAVFDLYGKFHFKLKHTYDAGKTPDKIRASVRVKPLDLQKLQAIMKNVVEEAKAIDPRLLRERISELEKLVVSKNTGKTEREIRPEEPKPVFSRTDIQLIESLCKKVSDKQERFAAELNNAHLKIVKSNESLELRRLAVSEVSADLSHRMKLLSLTIDEIGMSTDKPRKISEPKPETSVSGSDEQLSRCAKAILAVVAKRRLATYSQTAMISGYSVKSSGFSTAISELRANNRITTSRKSMTITEKGSRVSGTSSPVILHGNQLLEHWVKRLTKTEGALLQVVYQHKSTTGQNLSEISGYSITSSGFNGGIAALSKLGLIHVRPSLVFSSHADPGTAVIDIDSTFE